MKTLCLGCMETYDGEYEVCPFCGYIQGTPAKEAYHITPGVVIKGRYLIGRVLGSGGFGITYLGYDQVLEKKVAVKEYLPTEFATRMPEQTNVTVYAGDKEEQFLAGMRKSLDEAKRLAEFQQTAGITQVYDFFEENNTAYIVMEFLEGETLKEKLKRDGTMTVEEALPIVLAVLGALKAVHQKHIIHRDIAPDNIYLLKNGEVKLLDFGASRQVTTTHSKSLTVILKLGYAPVEQYQSGGNQGPWTDVYALAATFYKMITGIRPQESPERRIRDTLKEPSKLGVAIDKNMENALMNALHVRIEDRTKSAEEFEQALCSQEVARTQATTEKSDMGRWPTWLKAVCIAAGAAVLVSGGLIAAGVIRFDGPVFQGLNQDGKVMAPSLINLSQEAARERLEALGLTFKIGGTEASDTIMKGYVLSQQDGQGAEMLPGTLVEPGDVIQVTLSSGTGKTTIPNVLWMQEDAARTFLTGQELVAIETVSDTETWAPAGVVTGIEPAVGSEIKVEEIVTLKIAAGNAGEDGQTGSMEETNGETMVPPLTGITEEEAYEQLRQQGLFMEKQELAYSAQVPEGQVISQNPAEGTAAKAGDIISVTVSAGPKMVQLPSVVNMAVEEARTNLENLGLRVTVTEEYSSTAEAQTVIAQSVEPGMTAEGTEVTLTVSRGPEPVSATRPAANSGGSDVGRTPGPQNRQPEPEPQTQAQTQAPPPQTQAPTQPATTAAPVDNDTDW